MSTGISFHYLNNCFNCVAASIVFSFVHNRSEVFTNNSPNDVSDRNELNWKV